MRDIRTISPEKTVLPQLNWRLGLSMTLAVLLAVPILAVVYVAFGGVADWLHLWTYVLPNYIFNSLALMIFVGVGTLVVGTVCAWLVTITNFPGRSFFVWALLLPLAMPTYVVTFIYIDLLDYAGPVQSFVRSLFGFTSPHDYWFPQIRSLSGAGFIFTLVLYPYVYMLARAAFLSQSVCLLDVGVTLGLSPIERFRRIALPLARPGLVVGVSLALMETLNDFGAVSQLSVEVFSFGIYRLWLGTGNLSGAAQLAICLLAFVLILISLERLARGDRAYHWTTGRVQRLPDNRTKPWQQALALAICAGPVCFGFVIPFLRLVQLSALQIDMQIWSRFSGDLLRSLSLALVAALLITLVGTWLAYVKRIEKHPLATSALRLSAMGYAVPGSVIAVGTLIPFAGFDRTLDHFLREYFGFGSGLLLSGTVAALLFAYMVRFLALAGQSLEAGLEKITPSMDQAARTLGATPHQILSRVHLPLVRPSLLTAALLVFVDVMKELPATLILRPFDFATLATRVYDYVSDERIHEAGPWALAIVLTGLLPIFLLSRTIASSRPGQGEFSGLVRS